MKGEFRTDRRKQQPKQKDKRAEEKAQKQELADAAFAELMAGEGDGNTQSHKK